MQRSWLYPIVVVLVIAAMLWPAVRTPGRVAAAENPGLDIAIVIEAQVATSAVKRAAKRLVDQIDESRDQVAVISYGRDARTVQRLTSDTGDIDDAIDSIRTENEARMARGIAKARDELDSSRHSDSNDEVIVLFARGANPDQPDAVDEANRARGEGVMVVVVGVGDNPGDDLLRQVAGSDFYYFEGGTNDQMEEIYFNLTGRSATGPAGIDVAAIVDRSVLDSDVRRSVRRFLEQLNEESDQVALITYGAYGDRNVRLTNEFGRIRATLDGIKGGGVARLAPAIFEGIQELISARARAGSRRVMLIWTDGRVEDRDAAEEMANIARDNDVTVYTLGMGNADDNYLEDIADDNDFYFEDPDSEEFARIYSEVAPQAEPTATPVLSPTPVPVPPTWTPLPVPQFTALPIVTPVPFNPTPFVPTPVVQPTPVPIVPTIPPVPPPNSLYFPETGFAITNPAMQDYFIKRGGLRTFGYPVSREFLLLGFRTQFFQRQVMQQNPDGSVVTVNILDPEYMPYTEINGSRFPAPDPGLMQSAPNGNDPEYDRKVIEFVRQWAPDNWDGHQVNFYSAFLNTVRCEDAFPNGDCDPSLLPLLNLELWGIPISQPQYDPSNRNFIYLRFQRGIMHYDATSGATQALLLADYLKAIITGQNLPADLEGAARGSRFYRQYNNSMPNGLMRGPDLPVTNMQFAFERQGP